MPTAHAPLNPEQIKIECEHMFQMGGRKVVYVKPERGQFMPSNFSVPMSNRMRDDDAQVWARTKVKGQYEWVNKTPGIGVHPPVESKTINFGPGTVTITGIGPFKVESFKVTSTEVAPYYAQVFNALIEQTQRRGGSPSCREISDLSLRVDDLLAAYTQVREHAVVAGMSQALANAIEAMDGHIEKLTSSPTR